MTEDELIEKVAGEMADADNEGGDYGMTGADVMDCERGREAYVKRARAALAAIRKAGCEVVLRDPTPDQLTAGGTITGWNEAAPKNADECHVEWWKAMLSASPLKGET